jgi:hypothetical protein
MFFLHGESSNIIRLRVHLPNEQAVYFREKKIVEKIVEQAKITLTK